MDKASEGALHNTNTEDQAVMNVILGLCMHATMHL